MEEQEILGFDYVNLNEIDPNQQKIPAGVYTLKVMKAGIKAGISRNTGNPYQCVELVLAIQDDESFAGRRIWASLFNNDGSLVKLRKIMDATGVTQTPGTPLTSWLEELSIVQPTFKAPITLHDDVDKAGNARSLDYKGETAKRNDVDFWRVVPA